MRIEPYSPHHLQGVVRLSLRAWEPVFESIRDSLEAEVYQAFYPEGWRIYQQKAVEDVCGGEDAHVWIALVEDVVAGFVAVNLHPDDSMGEIHMVATDPDFQGRGVGAALTEHALQWMREAGLAIAMVETGGDPGHGPARKLYETTGFRLWPVARYFKKL